MRIVFLKNEKKKRKCVQVICKKCPFTILMAPRSDTYDGLPKTTKAVQEVLGDSKK